MRKIGLLVRSSKQQELFEALQERNQLRALPARDRFIEAAKRDGVKLLGEYVNSHTQVICVCPHGKEVLVRPNRVQQGKSWCGCAVRKSEAAEVEFRALAVIAGVSITGTYLNSSVPVEAVCAQGHLCKPRASDIFRGVGWCHTCVQPADRLYLVTHSEWAKIGIASGNYRVRVHERYGWRLHKQWLNLEAHVCRRVEVSVRKLIQEGPHIEQLRMPQRGYLETFPLLRLSEVENEIEEELNRG